MSCTLSILMGPGSLADDADSLGSTLFGYDLGIIASGMPILVKWRRRISLTWNVVTSPADFLRVVGNPAYAYAGFIVSGLQLK